MLHDVNETAELDFVVVIDTAESSLAVLQKPRVFYDTGSQRYFLSWPFVAFKGIIRLKK